MVEASQEDVGVRGAARRSRWSLELKFDVASSEGTVKEVASRPTQWDRGVTWAQQECGSERAVCP